GSQLVHAFKEAVVIEPLLDDFGCRAREVRVQRDFVLSLHEVSASRNQTSDRANIGLGPFGFGLQEPSAWLVTTPYRGAFSNGKNKRQRPASQASRNRRRSQENFKPALQENFKPDSPPRRL